VDRSVALRIISTKPQLSTANRPFQRTEPNATAATSSLDIIFQFHILSLVRHQKSASPLGSMRRSKGSAGKVVLKTGNIIRNEIRNTAGQGISKPDPFFPPLKRQR
jgi:hypothetical protein